MAKLKTYTINNVLTLLDNVLAENFPTKQSKILDNPIVVNNVSCTTVEQVLGALNEMLNESTSQLPSSIPVNTDNYPDADFGIADENGNVLVQFKNGHIKTLNFDSSVSVVSDNKDVDLIIFCGQSNMAGRGSSGLAPAVIEGAGYEFRAVSDPSKLYSITEPFGYNENDNYINDGTKKTGSLVSAFVNLYYTLTGNKVIAVSAALGGTSSTQWANSMATGAANRFTAALTYLEGHGYNVKHKYMIWLQGETDGDYDVSSATYETNFATIWNIMKTAGCEKVFFIRIGEINVSPYTAYDNIINTQSLMCLNTEDYVLISTELASFRSKGLMKDEYHYTQQGYNLIGKQAATNLAYYTNNVKEPLMWDNKLNTLYYSKTSY